MIVQKLSLINFKNHPERHFDLSPQINCFVGGNGVGKTNILDALHYLSVGKSFLGHSDFSPIAYGEEFFSLQAEIATNEKTDTLKLFLPKDGKKTIKKNEKTYERLADHIGYLPCVMISPYDSNLISDSGESRRKFLDAMIAQTDHEYLHHLMQYQKTLKQRNTLLKYFHKNRTFDKEALAIYNPPLTRCGNFLHEKRKQFIEKLNPIVQEFYQTIASGKEKVAILYDSALHDHPMEQLLDENLDKDRQLTYTASGVHKDDLGFEMNEKPLKKTGSQGQQKSFLIALKLAQIQRIKDLTGKNPILLLDDIFDKLDDHRVAKLITLVNRENFGQIFITDTHRERTESVVKRINEESRLFEIE
ncbi:DNA replication/repair protein RecF [Bergeyella sp. RCAD1439]|uniref:DNA replication/repair protein RecF n=1 Tax=Bergeyella anatis TaxID=3113737 RepID=UPI002E16BBEF|nr:DNA replication/repair protein RecF [Bergeyella sp. RCAD1439]